MTVSENPADSVAGGRPEGGHALIWDLPVRLFHGTLVAAVLTAFVTNKLGAAYFTYHLWSGYAVIVLVGFRLLWGFVGTHHARFRHFVRGPAETLAYLRDVGRGQDRPYAGHNPLGALMVLALLAALAVQAVTGLFGNDEIFNTGPLAALVDKDLSLRLTSLHRHLFLGIAGAVGLHVLAVLVHVLVKKEPLLRAMVTGHKPAHHGPEGIIAIASSRSWLAGLLVAGLSAVLAWVVLHAPSGSVDLTGL